MPAITRPSPALLLAAAAPLLVAACASQVTLPALPDCHPANAEARSAPLPAPSGLLDPAAPIPAAEPDLLEDHGAHRADPAADHGHARPAGEEHRHDSGPAAAPTGHEHHHPPAAGEQPPMEHDHQHAAGGAPGDDSGHARDGMHGHAHGDDPADAEAATVYACPMHPEVRSDSPGACPHCGMALVPVAPAEERPEEADEEHDHEHDHGGHR